MLDGRVGEHQVVTAPVAQVRGRRRIGDVIDESPCVQVLAEHPKIKGKPETVVRSLLQKVTKRPFYNLSKLDLSKLLDDPNQLAPNLNAYINGFSKNVREIMERFAFDQQIARMAEKNLLYEVVKAFCDPKIDLTFPGLTPAQANIRMGYVFEELIRIGQ